jgi:hypothetical protein
MEYEDDNDDDIDEIDFLNERDVWNRVGGPDLGTGLINLKIGNYTPNEKFKLIAASTIKIINDYDVSELITDAQATHILTLDEKIPDFQYKNPSAFVMGYIVAVNSNYKTLEINRSTLETVFEINKNIEQRLFSKIDNVDIIRYTRLCLLHNLK